MIEVTAPELALAVVMFGGLITYVAHLKHTLELLRLSHQRLFTAKLEKLNIPDGTTVRIIFD